MAADGFVRLCLPRAYFGAEASSGEGLGHASILVEGATEDCNGERREAVVSSRSPPVGNGLATQAVIKPS
jgi:hypothetical protein